MGTKIRDIIDYYTDHDVSDEIKERVLERVSGSKDNEEVNDALSSLWNQAESACMSEDAISEAYKRLPIVDKKNEKSKIVKLFTWQRAVAVLIPLVMLVVFAKAYIQMSDDLKASQAIAMLQEHTIADESKIIILADGTKVKLNQGSVLLYPESFRGKERKVFLAGEAFFDIKHDDEHPFHVSTPYFEITDLGTSFSVSSYATDEEVFATLKTGKIELKVVGDNKVYSMNPNDQLVYNVKTKSINMRQVSNEDDGLSWQSKQIVLNDVTLAEATHVMSKVYGVKFSFRSAHYQNTKITIHFNRGESLAGAMAIVKNLIPGLEYEIKDNEVIVE